MRAIFGFTIALMFSFCLNGWSEDEMEGQYEGAWRTTNRRLDGVMTCVVTAKGDEKWQGRFYGVWQGAAFDYLVMFEGPPSDLRGTAKIDGADYTWKGRLSEESPRSFRGSFGGNRYTGNFDLKEKGAASGSTPR